MKKNVMMRVASLLMVCVLATTCGISGTFAKYVTSDWSEDSARVAKFGVTVDADFSELFDYEYDVENTLGGDTDGLSVKSILGGDVIAPGTAGELVDFTVGGQPEVDVLVSYAVEFELGANWVAEGDDYCPVVFTVNTKEYFIGGTDLNGADIDSVAKLETAVIDAIKASKKYYNAGADLADATDGVAKDLNVSWKWHFEGVSEGGDGPACQTDVKDTILGDAFNATIYLKVTCTVEQVD